MNKQIIPAIIAKTHEEMVKAIDSVKDHVDIIQLDVMDGKFVPNESLNFDLELPEFKGSYEAHLMIQDFKAFIEKYVDDIDNFIVHFESIMNNEDFEAVMEFVRLKNKKISIAINPDTTLDEVNDYLEDVDMVLVMTVDPGFYGSKFIPGMVDKIKELRDIMPKLDIEVDGGINDKTIKLVSDAGANMIVSGSFIMKSEDKNKSVEILKKLVE